MLLIAAILAGASYGYRVLVAQETDDALIEVVLQGRVGTLDSDTMQAVNDDLSRLTRDHRQTLHDALQAWSQQRLDATFSPAEDAVSAYLDWYYSLGGSYLRLGYALMGDLDDLLASRMSRYLFEDSGIQAGLETFEDDMLAEFLAQTAQGAQDIGGELHRLHGDRLQPLRTDDGGETVARLDFDRVVPAALQATDSDIQRWRDSAHASALGGGAAIGLLAARPLAARLLARPAAQQATRPLLAYLAKLSPRLIAALTAGGTAGAATAPSGPGALVAGTATVVTTAGIFVSADWALLKAEEMAQRDELERELLAGLEQVRQEMLDVSQDGLDDLLTQVERHRSEELVRAYDEAEVPRIFHILR